MIVLTWFQLRSFCMLWGPAQNHPMWQKSTRNHPMSRHELTHARHRWPKIIRRVRIKARSEAASISTFDREADMLELSVESRIWIWDVAENGRNHQNRASGLPTAVSSEAPGPRPAGEGGPTARLRKSPPAEQSPSAHPSSRAKGNRSEEQRNSQTILKKAQRQRPSSRQDARRRKVLSLLRAYSTAPKGLGLSRVSHVPLFRAHI